MVIIEANTPEEIQQAFAWLSSRNAETSDTCSTKKVTMTGAERVRKCRENKKTKNIYVTENVTDVTGYEENVTFCNENVTENVTETLQQEKREEEKEEVSPLCPPLPFSPETPFPIPPYNPPLPEEKEGERKELAAAVHLPKNADSNGKSVLPVPNQDFDSQKTANEKPKLHPEDDAFWNFAKEEKSRAQAFYQATGLYPLKGEFGRWIKELRKFTEANVSTEIMLSAIEKQKQDGITISAPGSVLSNSRSMNAGLMRASPTSKEPQRRESWSELAARLKREQECGTEVIDI